MLNVSLYIYFAVVSVKRGSVVTEQVELTPVMFATKVLMHLMI